MAPLAPQLLELPLLGACLGFSIAAMGLGGADYHDFMQLRQNMAASPFPGFVYLEDNGILQVDLLLLIAGAVTFFFSIVGLALAGRQFPKRRGEYSGKGTSAWLIFGLILLLLSGLWAGTAAAYTAFSVMKTWSFSPGPNFSEPFTTVQKAYLRAVSMNIQTGETKGSLDVLALPGATGITDEYFGRYNVNTLQQINAIPKKYVRYGNKWQAAVIVSWFALSAVFLNMVVHFALPYVWGWLKLKREKREDGRKTYYDRV
ncbi:unnamed protein product [Sympodiomycopsis kandeliae]